MKQLDISEISAGQRLESVTKAFAALEPGHDVTIISNESLQELLREFQAQFWRKYDWMPMAAGPTSWRGKLIKRKEAETGPETIHHFMEADHARCDQFYAAGEAAVSEGNLELGRELLTAFDLCMHRHFAMEEQLFFPAFEERTGMTQGPTQVMRMEHEQMRNVLGQMRRALQADDAETVLGAGETLLILLQQHNVKEENMLYPMGDVQIPDITEDLLKQMQLVGT